MSVSDGMLANQTTFNNAFPSRVVDTSLAGKLTLQNGQPESGAVSTNVQRDINGLNAFTGRAANAAFDSTPTYSSTNKVANADSLVTAVGKLDAEFNSLTGSLRARAGRYALGNATSTATISLGSSWADNNYVVAISIENSTDTDPIFLQAIVTARASGNFSIKLNAPTDSANYVVHWSVRPQT